ncbi:MAG: hypothetical protein KJ799_17430 [Bacteroidetes bacterium]|nr:hypothetical protein [Bacteroidota bacterium]
MDKYIYFTLTPEALIASMLPPEDFGNYLAVGTKKRTRGQAIYFSIDKSKIVNHFKLSDIDKRCIAHDDGSPKRSVYISIYRVLELLPINALQELHLVTDDGRVLTLQRGEYTEEKEVTLHLYQQLCPVTPRIASAHSPKEFMQIVTDTTRPVSVPKLIFVELKLDDLATDPKSGSYDNLPYQNIDHLRDCLIGLKNDPGKATKTVIRFFQGELPYRVCKSGFFVGDQKSMVFYPFPSIDDLNEKYYTWWKSAHVISFK